MSLVTSRGAIGVVLAIGVALALPACKGGGSATGAAGSTGAGGQGGGGTDGGGAGADGAAGQDAADHTIVVWPPFPPGMCSPMKPAVLEGPGVVDPEDLCMRLGGDVAITVLALGEWGYGSMGIINNSSADGAWPDTDTFALRPGPVEGQVVHITIEALPGQDFQPSGRWFFNGGSGLGSMGPLASDPSKSRREVMVAGGAFELQLMVTDARALNMGDTQGAGALYRVRFDLVTKTPIPLGALPVLVTEDFTREGQVGVYSFDVPATRGRLLLDVAAAMRPTNLPPSPLTTSVMLFDPVANRAARKEFHDMTQDTVVAYEVDPKSPGSTLPSGTYWLMIDTPSVVATASRTDYDVSIDFRGPPANDTCAGAIDVTPAGTTAVTTTGDTTYAADDSDLSGANTSTACTPATAIFGSLSSRDVFYSVAVPARKHLTATLTPSGTWHPALWMSTACSAGEFFCVSASGSTSSTGAQTVAWTNVAATATTVYLTVDSAQDWGAFSLATTLSDGPAPPANDTCAGAIALDLSSGAATKSGTTDGAYDDEHPAPSTVPAACQDTSANYNGPDVVYTAVVPAGKRLSVTAYSATAGFDPALWISEACADAAASCLAARDGTGTNESVVWTNAGTADKPVTIHVDSQDPVGGGFSLSASLGAPKACPTTTRDPTIAYVGTTKGEGNDFIFSPANVSAACSAAVTKPLIGDDDITAFQVPPGKTLSITVKSTITFNGQPADAWVGLLTTACGTAAQSGAACVAAGTSLSWQNTDTAPRTVYLFLDTATSTAAQADYNVLPSLK